MCVWCGERSRPEVACGRTEASRIRAFCGIDWAENHYDVALADNRGQLIAKRRINDDAAGFRELLELLAEHGDTAAEPIPVAIETSRGLLVACLRTTGRPVYAMKSVPASREHNQLPSQSTRRLALPGTPHRRASEV